MTRFEIEWRQTLFNHDTNGFCGVSGCLLAKRVLDDDVAAACFQRAVHRSDPQRIAADARIAKEHAYSLGVRRTEMANKPLSILAQECLAPLDPVDIEAPGQCGIAETNVVVPDLCVHRALDDHIRHIRRAVVRHDHTASRVILSPAILSR